MTMKLPIFLDHHSTTPTDARVLETMLPFFTESFGNASSRTHSYGWEAAKAVDLARESVARLIKASPKEIFFTSGATESTTLALIGLAEERSFKGSVITTQTEHAATLATCRFLEAKGVRVKYLPVDNYGTVTSAQIEKEMTSDTFLVSVIFANNEVGTIAPIVEIGALCKERKVFFHTDAVQAVGKIHVDIESMNIDLLSLSGHKIYGPKGIGALFLRKKDPRVKINSWMKGGGQEMGVRGGTLNVPGIVGLGKACEISLNEMTVEFSKTKYLRDKMRDALLSDSTLKAKLNGHPSTRLPNNLSLTFADIKIQTVLAKLHRDVALSTGSTCSSELAEPSHVLRALGHTEEEAKSTLRIGIGRFNTEEEIDHAIKSITASIRQSRGG